MSGHSELAEIVTAPTELVKRLMDAAEANDVKELQSALDDFERLPRTRVVDGGCWFCCGKAIGIVAGKRACATCMEMILCE